MLVGFSAPRLPNGLGNKRSTAHLSGIVNTKSEIKLYISVGLLNYGKVDSCKMRCTFFGPITPKTQQPNSCLTYSARRAIKGGGL